MGLVTITPPTRLRPWRLTVGRYLRMIEAGILTEKDRVYLWRGQLVSKMTKGRPHTLTVLRLTDALKRVVPVGWYVEPEQPMILGDESLPEPDLKIVRGRMEDYASPPASGNVPLVIEVADSTLAEDRGEALNAYASEAVPTFWIANVPDRQIEVYSVPTGSGVSARYARCVFYRVGEHVPVALDGREVGLLGVAENFPEGPTS